MIQYSLKCTDGHQFDSWFQSASAFDTLKASGHLSCAICGGTEVDKALMAPRVTTEPAAKAPLSTPSHPEQEALRQMRKHVEANSDYVGKNFVTEARAMHLGEAPARAIWGEARGEDAKALIEEGIPVAPLPFLPSRKSN